jgi:hypothetical protein
MSSEKQKRESAPPIIPSHKRAEKAQYFLAEVKYEQLTAQNQHLIIRIYQPFLFVAAGSA